MDSKLEEWADKFAKPSWSDDREWAGMHRGAIEGFKHAIEVLEQSTRFGAFDLAVKWLKEYAGENA